MKWREAIPTVIGALLVIGTFAVFKSFILFGAGVCLIIAGLVMAVGRIGSPDPKGERYYQDAQGGGH